MLDEIDQIAQEYVPHPFDFESSKFYYDCKTEQLDPMMGTSEGMFPYKKFKTIKHILVHLFNIITKNRRNGYRETKNNNGPDEIFFLRGNCDSFTINFRWVKNTPKRFIIDEGCYFRYVKKAKRIGNEIFKRAKLLDPNSYKEWNL